MTRTARAIIALIQQEVTVVMACLATIKSAIAIGLLLFSLTLSISFIENTEHSEFGLSLVPISSVLGEDFFPCLNHTHIHFDYCSQIHLHEIMVFPGIFYNPLA